MRNALLGGLIAVVLAITGLNCYTTQSNLAYFTEATEYDNRQLVLIKAANDAQRVVEHVALVASASVERAERIQQQAMALLAAVSEEDNRQETYIRTLTKILKQNKLQVPERPSRKAQTKEPPRKQPVNRTASLNFVSVK